jgi:hypothetical protein
MYFNLLQKQIHRFFRTTLAQNGTSQLLNELPGRDTRGSNAREVETEQRLRQRRGLKNASSGGS